MSTKAELDSKLEKAIVKVEIAATEFDKGNLDDADVALSDAHALADEVLTAMEDGDEDLDMICTMLEDIGDAADWRAMEADELAATRTSMDEIKTALIAFELPEDDEAYE